LFSYKIQNATGVRLPELAASWLTGAVQVALSSLGGLAGFAVAATLAWRLFVFFQKPAATFA
jgi:hypothetical protein